MLRLAAYFLDGRKVARRFRDPGYRFPPFSPSYLDDLMDLETAEEAWLKKAREPTRRETAKRSKSNGR